MKKSTFKICLNLKFKCFWAENSGFSLLENRISAKNNVTCVARRSFIWPRNGQNNTVSDRVSTRAEASDVSQNSQTILNFQPLVSYNPITMTFY